MVNGEEKSRKKRKEKARKRRKKVEGSKKPPKEWEIKKKSMELKFN